METWQKLKERQQQEVNAFPMACAFRDDDLPAAFDKLGVSCAAEVVGLGMGCMIRRADLRAYCQMMKRHKAERAALMRDAEAAAEAVRDEAHNHEYEINWDGAWNLAGVFGWKWSDADGGFIDFDGMGEAGAAAARAFAEGLRRYREDCRRREREEFEREGGAE